MDLEVRSRLRAWLRHYKDRRGWTNEKLARELDLSEPTITNILNSKRSAGLDVLVLMHRKLGKSADDLLDSDPPAAPK
jgi:transcriptional regulator with XRE-family HTH domain